MINVIVADDHLIFRKGVIQVLNEAPDICVTGEASSGREALKLLREKPCDVLLLDIMMPEGSGMETLVELRQITPRPKILVLSFYPESQYARRAMKNGADGYITKDSLPDELLSAIHKVSAGGKYISQELAEVLVDELSRNMPEDVSHKALSEREFQVMAYLAGGKTIAQIADELLLSANTVSTYRRRILEKLELKNTGEIIRYAIQHKLTE